MTKRFFPALLAGVALLASSTLVMAADAPDFSAIMEQLNSSAPAAQPQVKDIDFSKAETNVMAYIASIARQADEANVPFTKLAQQFIWGSDKFQRQVAGPVDPLKAEARGANRPFIMVGGYWDTQISATTGGTLTLICYVSDPDGPADIKEVELYYNQQPTGALLKDDSTQGDFAAGDQVYGIQAPIAAPYLLPAGQYLLELVARDFSGNESDMWPYLTIN